MENREFTGVEEIGIGKAEAHLKKAEADMKEAKAAETAAEHEIDEAMQELKEVEGHHKFKARIDGESVEVDTQFPTGESLLEKVGKRSCAFDLIAEFNHHENDVIDPEEVIDLRAHGLKGFITAHKEIVTIYINDKPYTIAQGDRSVAEILAKVGETPEGYDLFEEKGGPPLPLPANLPVNIFGCETFHTQVQSGGSS